MKETTDCKKRACVRFDDNNGWGTKIYKTKFPSEFAKKHYHICVKYVEQLARGFSPTSVAKKEKFQKFRKVSEGLKPKTLPEDFQSLPHKKKLEAVKKLVDEIVDELAAAMSHGPVQGVDTQADGSDTMQVGESSARQFDKTVREVKNPGQIPVDEEWSAAPNPDLGSILSNYASMQNVAWNGCDNSQGWPPARPPVAVQEVVLFFNHLRVRASRFPEMWSKFDWSEEAFRSFVNRLELLEGALVDDSNTFLRSREADIFPRLESDEDLQNVTIMQESLADEFWSNFPLLMPEAPGTNPNFCAG